VRWPQTELAPARAITANGILREWWNKIRSTILLEQGTQFHVDTLVRQLDACLNKTKTSPPRLVSHLTHAITRIQSFEPSRSNRL